MYKTGIDINLFLQAQCGPDGIEEAIRQIRSGRITGDWLVWLFPATEKTIEEYLWTPFEMPEDPHKDERFMELRRYALKDGRDAEELIFNPAFAADLERICSMLLEYDGEAILKIFNHKQLTQIWSSLSIFRHLRPGSPVEKLHLKVFGEGNLDLLSITYLWNESNERSAAYN